MLRKAFVMQVKPDAHDEYARRHDALWPEMAETLKAHGAHGYSIQLDAKRSLVFAYVEIESEERWASVADTAVALCPFSTIEVCGVASHWLRLQHDWTLAELRSGETPDLDGVRRPRECDRPATRTCRPLYAELPISTCLQRTSVTAYNV